VKLPRNVKIFRGQLDAAPFAGVFFLLVILLVLESKLVFSPGVRINLPAVRQALPGANTPTVVVAVDLAGHYYYQSQGISEEKLQKELKAVVQGANEPLTLEILADQSAALEPAFRLMSLAGDIGFQEILCVVRPQPLPKKVEGPSL